MTRRLLYSIIVAAALVALPALGQTQEEPKPDASKPETSRTESAPERRGPLTTLRVQVVISRFQGEKKIASLPYTLVVTTDGGRARMRMGVDTPIPVTSTSESGKQTTTIQYHNVGTNIDCTARGQGNGLFRLVVGVESSSALALEKGPSGGASPPPGEGSPTGIPLFRRFDTNLDALLRDGQSLQTIAATDPVTGELVKIDVTMNVVR